MTDADADAQITAGFVKERSDEAVAPPRPLDQPADIVAGDG